MREDDRDIEMTRTAAQNEGRESVKRPRDRGRLCLRPEGKGKRRETERSGERKEGRKIDAEKGGTRD